MKGPALQLLPLRRAVPGHLFVARRERRETPSPGLTYNLRVGTTPSGDEVMSGHAITSPEARLVPAMGNCQHNTSWTLKGLASGTYYWSVQAVDSGFEGGPWAAEQQVTVPQSGGTRKPRKPCLTPFSATSLAYSDL